MSSFQVEATVSIGSKALKSGFSQQTLMCFVMPFFAKNRYQMLSPPTFFEIAALSLLPK
jgi:hypothetical protein